MKKSMVFYSLFILACSRPEAVDFKHEIAIGEVIAKESCSGESLNEYWVFDLYHQNNKFKSGDSLFLNGIKYTNVVKGIVYNPFSVQKIKIGQKVVFDFEKKLPVQNIRSCSTNNPEIYQVKQVIIKKGSVGELRGG